MTTLEAIYSALEKGYIHENEAIALLARLRNDAEQRLLDIEELNERISKDKTRQRAYQFAQANNGEFEIDEITRAKRRKAGQCLICALPSGAKALCVKCIQDWQCCCHCKRILLVTSGRFCRLHSSPNGYAKQCRDCIGVELSIDERRKRRDRLALLRAQGFTHAECAQRLGFASAASSARVLYFHRQDKVTKL